MSPEQLMDKTVSAKSDIYSFGCLFYNLCTYQQPWKRLNMVQISFKFVNKEVPDMNEKECEGIPSNITIIIQKKNVYLLKQIIDLRHKSYWVW